MRGDAAAVLPKARSRRYRDAPAPELEDLELDPAGPLWKMPDGALIDAPDRDPEAYNEWRAARRARGGVDVDAPPAPTSDAGSLESPVGRDLDFGAALDAAIADADAALAYRPRRPKLLKTARGDAAAARRIVRRRVAATPRLRRGHSAETSVAL